MTAMVMGFHAYSTIMDYNVDKTIGVKTFATIFGKRSASFFALFVSILTLFLLTLRYCSNQSLIIFLDFVVYCFLSQWYLFLRSWREGVFI